MNLIYYLYTIIINPKTNIMIIISIWKWAGRHDPKAGLASSTRLRVMMPR